MKRNWSSILAVLGAIALLAASLTTRQWLQRQPAAAVDFAGAALEMLLAAALFSALLVHAVPRLGTLWGALAVAAAVTVLVAASGLPAFTPLVSPLWRRQDASRFLVLLVLLVEWWCFAVLFARFLATRVEGRALREVRRQLPFSDRPVEPGVLEESLGSHAGSAVVRRVRGLITGAALPEHAARQMTEEAALEAARLQTAYGPLRALVWALPALGFIGTAAAMAGSIAGVGSALDGEAGAGAQADLVTRVIPHLADAFSITLVALGSTVLCFFLLSVTYAREERVLIDTDALLLELSGRLREPRMAGHSSDVSDRLLTELWSLEREIAKLSGQLDRILEGRGYSETLSAFLSAIVIQLKLLNESASPEAGKWPSGDGHQDSQTVSLLREIAHRLEELNHLVTLRSLGAPGGEEMPATRL